MIVAIKTFQGKELKIPIEVTAFEIDRHYYVSNSKYKVYGYGNSHEDAMDSFIQQLEEMYNQCMELNSLIL